jgi:hypothetical protein
MVRMLLALMLCSAVLCTAQDNDSQSETSEIRFGIKGGGHVSFYRVEYNNAIFQSAVIPFVTVLAGGFVTVPIIDELEVEAGLEHAWKGATQYTPMLLTSALSYQAPTYIQVPVKLVAKLGKFRVGVGGYAGYGISGEYANVNTYTPSISSRGTINFNNDDPNGMNPWDLGVTAEIGYMLGQFRISIYNYTGLTNALSKARTIDDTFISNIQIGTGIAYVL